MALYVFHQNNSGGSFEHSPTMGIGHNVVIEARDLAHAVARAEEIGLYFDGVEDGADCSCCGDRWSRCAWEAEEGEVFGGGMTYIHREDGTVEAVRAPGWNG